jgi:serine protease DegS
MRSRILRFILGYSLIGVAAAAVILALAPAEPETTQPVVQIRQAPAPSAGPGIGPVSYADAVDAAAPAVVNIYSSKRVAAQHSPLHQDPLFRRFFGERLPAPSRERVETSLGSGVIISPGYVLTNNHVTHGADQIQVALSDGRTAEARLVGADPETDLAVLAIELADAPNIVVGDSERLRVGDVVLAVGNPFGVGQTVTQGIVSATGRDRLGLSTFEDFIQTDAAINPGNSGGALIDAHGRLVGINTAIFSRSGGSQGIGFAIPSKLALGVLESILAHGRVIRGWLGIEVQALSPQLAESFGLASPEGVVVAGILRRGPADQAGLLPGDVIQRLDDTPVQDPRTLLTLISQRKPGEKMTIRGVRGGEAFETEAAVSERPGDLVAQ